MGKAMLSNNIKVESNAVCEVPAGSFGEKICIFQGRHLKTEFLRLHGSTLKHHGS